MKLILSLASGITRVSRAKFDKMVTAEQSAYLKAFPNSTYAAGAPASKTNKDAHAFFSKYVRNATGAHMKAHAKDMIHDAASAGHAQWQKDFAQTNGSGAKRMKKTTDATWIKKHGAEEVDLAHTSYANLPTDWKKENLEGAKSAVDFMVKHKGSFDVAAADKASAHVHKKWLERNGAWAPESQKKPFHKLTKDEQDKDRFFVLQAMKSFIRRSK